MKKIVAILAVCINITWLCAGCALFQTEAEKSAEELLQEGQTYFEDGRYRKAIESFEKLKDWYPFSKHATLAELKIADAHFEIEEYEDAIFAYEAFENLHPTNPKMPYVVYRIGKAYFVRVDTVDRDQSTARKALDTFQRLIRTYPDSPYAARANEHITDCLKSLAGNETYVGLFYYKGEHYKAALHRFQSVVTDYPDAGLHKTALQFIPLCEKGLQDSVAHEAIVPGKKSVEKKDG